MTERQWTPAERDAYYARHEGDERLTKGLTPLGIRMPVLDHGYVQLIEHWGSDEMIVETARMSTQKGFLGWGETCAECGWAKGDDHEVGCSQPDAYKPGDEKLLRFMWLNKHSTPFEFAGASIEVQAPLFVFREWHRHRTQSYSERSARYAPLPDDNFMPTPERLMRGGPTRNKQAASVDGSPELTLDSALEWLDELAGGYEMCERIYQSGLKRGVPKELARVIIPVGRYSAMRAATDLRNWLGFCTLRLPASAQEEIRVYADAVHGILSSLFPRTLALFDETFAKPA